MAKNYATFTVEFNTDAPWEDVVRNLITKIGDIANDELGYLVTKVYSGVYLNDWNEEENWDD